MMNKHTYYKDESVSEIQKLENFNKSIEYTYIASAGWETRRWRRSSVRLPQTLTGWQSKQTLGGGVAGALSAMAEGVFM